MKSCSMRKMQIKATMNYHYVPIRMVNIQNILVALKIHTDFMYFKIHTDLWQLTAPNAGWNSHLSLVGMQNCQATLEDRWAVPDNIKYAFTIFSNNTSWYLAAITHLGFYQNELKTQSMCIFIGALFITAKTCKQSRCPSVGE